MSRVKIAIVLLFSILLISTAGYHSVARITDRVQSLMDTAQQQNQGGEFPALIRTVDELEDYYTSKEWLLSLFVRHDYAMNALSSLHALQSYASRQETVEFDAELARARAQVTALRHLFLRLF